MKNSLEEAENLIENKITTRIPNLKDNPNHIDLLKINSTQKQNNFNLDIADPLEETTNLKYKHLVDNQVTSKTQQIKDFEKLAEEELNRSKKHEYHPIFHFFSFLVSIIILYFCTLFHTDFSNSDYTYFLNIAENWKLSPLYNIYIGNGNCENAEDNILTDSWPGLTQGCECDGVLYKGECPKNKNNCFRLKNYENKKLTLWQNNNLCAIKKNKKNKENNINSSFVA